ncbi:segregation and condensation protein A [Sporosalibacterium faouarense]|uniref:segregation and condensation protein A n=1 Tax=Sporosalibacterium faouarense TaxID=516123 RepID=UPI00192ADAAB|nr:segregation/condensation protein A [Sporosalibacterium faouarense]
MEYKVVLETFEGPLDLLYHLIEKNKVDIYDIPIAKITDQYVEYIETMQELDMNVTSEFLVMVATLLEIKSKMLLPATKNDDENTDEDGVDPREELVLRLLEYKKYKTAAEELKNKEMVQSKVFNKPQEEIEHFIDGDQPKLEGIDLKDLLKAFSEVMNRQKKYDEEFDFHEIERDEITIEDAIDELLHIISKVKKIKFHDLFKIEYSKVKIVVTFLSVLELIRLNTITIHQERNFDDIVLIYKDSKGDKTEELNG